MKKVDYLEVDGKSGEYYVLLAGLLSIFGAGLFAAYFMETNGHVVTGMSNQIVWGMPHVFAVFLIVCASGALNVASIASVFGKSVYKPLAPLSGLLAIALLAGGLAILVLDLGRPDRLTVAMTHYNFKSIFAWNIFLYTGFLAIVAVYVWMMLERRFNHLTKPAGVTAFVWRLILTTGTGSIFGFLVARESYDAAIFAPMFILMSFSFGLAVFCCVLILSYRWTNRAIGSHIVNRLKRLLAVFIAAVLLIVAIHHLTKLYGTGHLDVEAFLLRDGGVYPILFWVVFIGLGSILPMAIFLNPRYNGSLKATFVGSVLVIVGGIAEMYVIIVGGQAFPLDIFPGYEVKSSFFDGQIASYTPSVPEWILGLGGIALVGLIVTIGIKFLRFLPVSLADADVDPHAQSGKISSSGT